MPSCKQDRSARIPALAARLAVSLEQMQAELPGGREQFQVPLPRAVQEAVRRAQGRPSGPALDQLLAAAAPIRAQPGWQAALSYLLLSPEPEFAPVRPAAATLLALQPLPGPDRLLERVGRMAAVCQQPPGAQALLVEEGRRLHWCLLALFLTDSTASLPLWRACFAGCGEQDQAQAADPAFFLCFLKLLQHRLLGYAEFSRAVIFGRVLHPETYCGRRARPPYYHPVLDCLDISQPPYFRLMYHRLVHELTAGEVPFEWERISWIRRYPGLAYLRRALQMLASEPTLQALHMARWAADFESEHHPRELLSQQGPLLLAVLCLLRRDLDALAAAVLADPQHQAGMRWLRLPGPAAFRQVAKDVHLQQWLQRRGELVCGAIGALAQFKPPESASSRLLAALQQEVAERLPGYAEQERLQRLAACYRQHFSLDLAALLANRELALGVRGKGVRPVAERARAGHPAAIRALALYQQPWRDRFAPLLLTLRTRGSRQAVEAAQGALELVAARCGLGGVAALEERLELQLAWEDAGLQGGPSRLWWQVAGCNLKLAVTGGRATVTAYSLAGPCSRLPAAVRRHPDYQEVRRAQRQLNAIYARFRDRLEAAMVAQRAFPWEHFRLLLENGIFRDLVQRLLLSDGEECFPGAELAHRPPPAQVRIVHPLELLQADTLRTWQDYLAEHSLIQPLKQCFREVYPVEPAEAGQAACLRFADHPLQARKAFALLRTRGYHPGSGQARRDWAERGVAALLVWAQGPVKLHHHLLGEEQQEPVYSGPISFHPLAAVRGRLVPGPQPLPLGQVDPVLFSETLRDADLLVSMAAAGELGFTSRQTIAIRAAMLRQLARLLKLWNVLVPETGSHALVEGALATYRVHLGSGTIFLEPEGRSITLRATRPAATLPLEDADSGTARLLLTVLTLAQDTEIADPAFRRQLSSQPALPDLDPAPERPAGPPA